MVKFGKKGNDMSIKEETQQDLYDRKKDGEILFQKCVTGIKDSGDRSKFASGAVRDLRIGKGMPGLIPSAALLRLAKHYEAGRVKYSDTSKIGYGDENWKKGIPLMCYFDSAVRHLEKWKVGLYDEDHLAAALWNVCGLLETERRIKEGILPSNLDNRDVNEFVKE